MAKEKTKDIATPEPWERQVNETPKQYEAFCIYRDMGIERSYDKVATQLHKSTTLIGRWGRQNDWQKRIAAWAGEQDRIARAKQTEEIVKMRKKHAKLAVDMLDKAAAALAELPIEEMKAVDISRMVEVASKLERQSRGDAGEIVEERDGGEAPSVVSFYIPENGRDKKQIAEEE